MSQTFSFFPLNTLPWQFCVKLLHMTRFVTRKFEAVSLLKCCVQFLEWQDTIISVQYVYTWCSKVHSHVTQSTIKVQLRNTNQLKHKVRKYYGNLSSISVQQVIWEMPIWYPSSYCTRWRTSWWVFAQASEMSVMYSTSVRSFQVLTAIVQMIGQRPRRKNFSQML